VVIKICIKYPRGTTLIAVAGVLYIIDIEICNVQVQSTREEPNQAKQRAKASFLPGGEPPRTHELKSPPWAKVCGRGPRGHVSWPKAGILVRLRFLGVTSFIRNFWKSGRHKAKYRYNCFVNSSGRGARIKKELSYGNLSAY
jgi:hypothetical protein